MKCEKCGKNMEGHGTEQGDFHWWICTNCGKMKEDPDNKIYKRMYARTRRALMPERDNTE